jgi:cysteine-rich repeat protein
MFPSPGTAMVCSWRLPLTLLFTLTLPTPLVAQTLIAGEPSTARVRQVDVATRAVLSETTVSLDGAHVAEVQGLAVHPEDGTLYGVLREVRCPGDPTRTEFLLGGCGAGTNNPSRCASAFMINDGVPVSCAPREDGGCFPCAAVNEGSLGCSNSCLGAPTCADQARTFAGNAGCGQFTGDQAACVQHFGLSECGPVACFVGQNGTTCTRCSAFHAGLGQCDLSTCGSPRSRDPFHLATIDVGSGVATSIGDLGDDVTGLTFACDGRLFGATGRDRCRAADREIITIDTATASVTPQVTILPGEDDDPRLTFDAAANVLVVASGAGTETRLASIDPTSLLVGARPVTGPAIDDEVNGIAWNRLTGELLWTHNEGSGPLFRVPADGVSVALGSVGQPLAALAVAGAGACDVCGDGRVTGLETCDDGNVASGDCCNDRCQRDALGTTCTAEDAVCSAAACGATACEVTPMAGFDGVECVLGALGAVDVCTPGAIPQRLRKQITARVRKLRSLVAAAETNPARAPRRLRAAKQQLAALTRTIEKRREKLGAECGDTLVGLAERLRVGLDDLG